MLLAIDLWIWPNNWYFRCKLNKIKFYLRLDNFRKFIDKQDKMNLKTTCIFFRHSFVFSHWWSLEPYSNFYYNSFQNIQIRHINDLVFKLNNNPVDCAEGRKHFLHKQYTFASSILRLLSQHYLSYHFKLLLPYCT